MGILALKGLAALQVYAEGHLYGQVREDGHPLLERGIALYVERLFGNEGFAAV